MAVNARSIRYTTVDDSTWLPIGAAVNTRRVFFLQVAADSSAVYVHIGNDTPSALNSFLLSALDVMDLPRADVIGPIHIKAATGGIASVVVLES